MSDHIFRKCVERKKQKKLTAALDDFFKTFNALDDTTAYTKLDIARVLMEYATDLAKQEGSTEADSFLQFQHEELTRTLEVKTWRQDLYQPEAVREAQEFLWKRKLN